MSDNNSPALINIGFLPLLALLFIGLKLAGAIHWSWFWVLSPLWVLPVGILLLLALGIIAGGILDWGDRAKSRPAKRIAAADRAARDRRNP